MFETGTEKHDAATNLCYAMMRMQDTDVQQVCLGYRGISEVWDLACEIVEHGPQNDMETRIVAAAVAHRLEGK